MYKDKKEEFGKTVDIYNDDVECIVKDIIALTVRPENRNVIKHWKNWGGMVLVLLDSNSEFAPIAIKVEKECDLSTMKFIDFLREAKDYLNLKISYYERMGYLK